MVILLLRSKIENKEEFIMSEVLKVENLRKYYGIKSSITKALDNVSFTVENGEYIGIMGASGSGKTTF